MQKLSRFLGAAIFFAAAWTGWAQIPSATGTGNVPGGQTLTNQKSLSGGRFGGDIDNYMGTRDWGGTLFDKHFFFIGGRYSATLNPTLGYAVRFGDYYLGLYYRGRILQGVDTQHSNASMDSVWNEDSEGHSKIILNDNVGVLFGVPGIGGFRFDWVADTGDGDSGPAFEKFKLPSGESESFNGTDVFFAEGSKAGSMAFLLSWGNTFAGRYKVDALAGFATPDTVDVTSGQDSDFKSYTYRETANTKVFAKAGFGYTLDNTSSVDADYSLVVLPGKEWEQTLDGAETGEKYDGNTQHIVNLNYSKTFTWNDNLVMKIKPNIGVTILAEKSAKEDKAGTRTDLGEQTTLTLVPSIAWGLQYTPVKRLSLYTGTTITLFDFQSKSAKKGADGIDDTYIAPGSASDVVQGAQSKFDIGAAFSLTDNCVVDFNVTQLLSTLFKSAPAMDLYLTFKK